MHQPVVPAVPLRAYLSSEWGGSSLTGGCGVQEGAFVERQGEVPQTQPAEKVGQVARVQVQQVEEQIAVQPQVEQSVLQAPRGPPKRRSGRHQRRRLSQQMRRRQRPLQEQQ